MVPSLKHLIVNGHTRGNFEMENKTAIELTENLTLFLFFSQSLEFMLLLRSRLQGLAS